MREGGAYLLFFLFPRERWMEGRGCPGGGGGGKGLELFRGSRRWERMSLDVFMEVG